MHESIGEYSEIGLSRIKDLLRMIGDSIPQVKIDFHIRINSLHLKGHMTTNQVVGGPDRMVLCGDQADPRQ